MIKMDKGHIYILQYIKNLEDQVLADNYDVGKELVRDKATVESLIDWLFHAKNMHEINEAAYDGYNAMKLAIPEQKYGLGWMQVDGKFQNEGNYYD
jgi:hypothetical protein